ncbi:MAG: RNase H-like domain-containing protein [Sedimenticola sp.]
MNWDASNLPEEWQKFKLHVSLIFTGPLKSKTEEEQVSYLLLWVGQKGREIYKTWSGISEADAKKLDTYYTRFKNYVQPKLNPIFARCLFNNEKQGSDNIDVFVTRLKTKAIDCNFAERDNMIRDRIVAGCTSEKCREKLINQADTLTMDKAIQIVQNYEYCQKQLTTMTLSGATGQTVDAVQGAHASGARPKTKTIRKNESNSTGQTKKRTNCGNCGTIHKKGNCPAFGEKCFKCGKLNHFKKKCRSRPVHDIDDLSDYVNNGISSAIIKEYDIDTVSAFSSVSLSPDRAYAKLKIGPQKTLLNFKIDTGSAVNILTHSLFKSLNVSHPLEPSSHKLTSYTGNMIPVIGMIRLACSHKDKVIHALFYVVEGNTPPLISLQSSVDLGLIKLTYDVESSINVPPVCALDKQKIQNEYRDLFTGIGIIPGAVKLHLKDNAVPVVNPPRRIPEALKFKLKCELDAMEKDQIIMKVNEPTDWVNSLVVVEKPKTGKLRICLDPKALNEAIRRPHYPMFTLEDVTSKLTNATCFSLLDITHAYWSVRLDEESSYLTTFGTPFGRYRYLRLPFGISSSADLFQRKVNEVFEGLPGVAAIVDDILIYGRTRDEHDRNLRNVLDRARDKGICFNPDKMTIGVNELPFFGHIISDKGLKIDNSKVQAISELGIPDSREKLERFLGMVNYCAKFAPNLAELTAPLRNLLKKDTEFFWDHSQSEAFEKIKGIITKSPVLGYYDPSLPLVLEVDASKYGIGCCIMQRGRPIAFASKSLTKTEVGYAQIEKELLAILFGCKRFHQYTYGRQVIVHSDHKPISSIMKKPLSAAPPRLMRMLLQLQKYNIEVIHKSGKDIPVSDFLSRSYLSDTYPDLTSGLDFHVHTVLQQLFVTDRRLESIKTEIKQDAQMQDLQNVILQGWPETRSDCKQTVMEYWNHRDELSVEKGLIFRGQKILIPKSLRAEMLKQVHTGHLGVTKTLERAKDNLFWPGMTKAITDNVLSCEVCLAHRDSNAKEPLIVHDVPQGPYQKLGSDIFTFEGKNYLLTSCYYSRFFEIDLLPDMRAETVIRKLKVHLSRNGICQVLITDNGPSYACQAFADFAREWGFQHQTTSPFYPKSNGHSEVLVGVAKKLLRKAKDSKQDPYLLLLEYRNTPLECGYSPAQLLMSRRTRSVVPITEKQLQPRTVDPKIVQKSYFHSKKLQKKYYDRTAKQLPPLHVNDQVRVQFGKLWKPARVIQKHNIRSYSVQTKDGAIYRRNRIHLMKTRVDTDKVHDFHPNVLAQPESQFSFDQAPLPLTTDTSNDIRDNSLPYITRSGRQVKPSQRYNSNEWITK